MSTAQTVAIIRDRGQLTIPDGIRKQVGWASPSSVVTISVDTANTITIKPHGEQKKVNWDTLWKMIRLVRSFKGKSFSASKFIAEDRYRH